MNEISHTILFMKIFRQLAEELRLLVLFILINEYIDFCPNRFIKKNMRIMSFIACLCLTKYLAHNVS